MMIFNRVKRDEIDIEQKVIKSQTPSVVTLGGYNDKDTLVHKTNN